MDRYNIQPELPVEIKDFEYVNPETMRVISGKLQLAFTEKQKQGILNLGKKLHEIKEIGDHVDLKQKMALLKGLKKVD